ncbi:SGNH/GDSL hydrolase family protein [Pseudoduganella umbonata]|uniref:SGNH/GDSL hydrolase family protein n=1 Tax=Pseudoduganella umbonata TaxID=864828 RepID=A0A4P8HTA9_9BURK|nr:SGNH/GDSL hydrolase family protein [Pseudoduganella umbonata]MBB3220523.1 hypothetical protein [Pseudoduganella umbonata]QCP11962.1 hypothetical protein FCL38_17230 [Pseudoduganella umbonata]
MAHAILLGDSIFDNRGYVPEGHEVAMQLRSHLGDAHEVTLGARDGSVLADMPAQFREVASLRDASTNQAPTHLVISCGGNDVLGLVGAMQSPVASVLEAAEMLAAWQADFRRGYRAMLQQADACGLRLVCADAGDYSAVSPIEPSSDGGRKIAASIAELLLADETDVVRTVVFGAKALRPGPAG